MLWLLDSSWGPMDASKTNPRQIQNTILQTWHTHISKNTMVLLGFGAGDTAFKIRFQRHVGLLLQIV